MPEREGRIGFAQEYPEFFRCSSKPFFPGKECVFCKFFCMKQGRSILYQGNYTWDLHCNTEFFFCKFAHIYHVLLSVKNFPYRACHWVNKFVNCLHIRIFKGSVVGFGNGHHDHKLPEPVFLSCARSTRSNENVFSGYKVRFFYESGYYLDVLVVRSCLPFIIRHIFVTAEYHRSFNGFTGFFLRGDIF